jgi:hypothetical protein
MLRSRDTGQASPSRHRCGAGVALRRSQIAVDRRVALASSRRFRYRRKAAARAVTTALVLPAKRSSRPTLDADSRTCLGAAVACLRGSHAVDERSASHGERDAHHADGYGEPTVDDDLGPDRFAVFTPGARWPSGEPGGANEPSPFARRITECARMEPHKGPAGDQQARRRDQHQSERHTGNLPVAPVAASPPRSAPGVGRSPLSCTPRRAGLLLAA